MGKVLRIRKVLRIGKVLRIEKALRKLQHQCLSMLLGITMLSLLAGCGFHLRGSLASWPVSLETLAIDYQAAQLGLKAPLFQQLGQLNVHISENARHRLVIENLESSNLVASYDTQGRPQQYTLTQTVTFHLIDTQSLVKQGPKTLSKSRTYRFDSSQIGGYTQEQRLLEQELQKTLLFELIQQLTRWVPSDTAQPTQNQSSQQAQPTE